MSMALVRIGTLLAILVLLALQAGCATQHPAAPKEERAASDPWEPMNRRVAAFNDNVDKVSLKPLAKVYDNALPNFLQTGLHNFFGNLREPLNLVNSLLQGKPRRGGIATLRFLANTVVGMGGLFDIATDSGLEPVPEDFGQTLAVWGIPDGPYVVLPILGPRTLRDAFMTPLDMAGDPVMYLKPDSHRAGVAGLRIIDTRAALFTAEALIEDSFDRYLSIRESYLQNRRYQVYDGDPPVDDDFYDEFYDDFEEDEPPPP